jgi:diacylglycerol kinase
METPDTPTNSPKESPIKQRRHWTAKFSDSFRGIRFALQEQSFCVHLFVALVVVGIGAMVRPSAVEWMLLVGVIGLVLVTEIVNSALERLSRAITVEQDPLIGQALDLASAAVLTASTLAVIVGVTILGPDCFRWLLSLSS